MYAGFFPPHKHSLFALAMEAAEGLPEEMAADAAGPSSVVDPWFPAFAQERGVTEFSRLLTEAGLQSFVESSDHPLTIFAPSNEAIMALGGSMPSDMQLLRELLCVHITMGNLRCVPNRNGRGSVNRTL